MQIIADVPRRVQELVAENATTVLTAGGVVGAVATGILAFRAGVKYQEVVEEELLEIIKVEAPHITTVHPLSTKEKIKVAWPHLIPPVAIGGVTVGCVVMSHRMSAAKAAALAAAYGVSQKQLEEYKAKMAEKLGVTKNEKAKTEMAQERANETPGASTVVIFGDEVLCFDESTGRYFKSTMEKIRRAENSTNQEIINHGFADASHFYSELELPGTRWSDDVGWTEPFELEISTIVADDKPCLSIDFKKAPVLDYVRGGDRYS